MLTIIDISGLARGSIFPDACRDANLNAQLAITGYTELGFDSIAPYFSIIQESSQKSLDYADRRSSKISSALIYNSQDLFLNPEKIRGQFDEIWRENH